MGGESDMRAHVDGYPQDIALIKRLTYIEQLQLRRWVKRCYLRIDNAVYPLDSVLRFLGLVNQTHPTESCGRQATNLGYSLTKATHHEVLR